MKIWEEVHAEGRGFKSHHSRIKQNEGTAKAVLSFCFIRFKFRYKRILDTSNNCGSVTLVLNSS